MIIEPAGWHRFLNLCERGVAQFAVQTGFTRGVYGDQRDLLIVPDVSRPERAWEIRSDGLNHRSRPVAVAPPVDPGCGSNLGHPADLETAHAFPSVNEPPQIVRIGQPEQGMHMVRHDDKADALSLHLLELMIQHSQDDSLRMIQIEQSSPPAH
jgi:hypothetical protein